MRRQIIFDPDARLEYEEAIVWYDEREAGLGDRFVAEVQATIRRILSDPERFPFRGANLQRAQVQVFNKYSILFRVLPDLIIIPAVFHGARNPKELRQRMK